MNSMSKLSWMQVVEPRGLSFDSMREVFLHLTLVEDRWINYTIPGRFGDWVDSWLTLIFDAFKDFASLNKYRQEVEEKTERYLKGLSQEELNRKIQFPRATNPASALRKP